MEKYLLLAVGAVIVMLGVVWVMGQAVPVTLDNDNDSMSAQEMCSVFGFQTWDVTEDDDSFSCCNLSLFTLSGGFRFNKVGCVLVDELVRTIQ